MGKVYGKKGRKMLNTAKSLNTACGKINKSQLQGLTPEKKVILKSLMGSASSPKIDMNKIRNFEKYGED
jgi:hypothetical protein